MKNIEKFVIEHIEQDDSLNNKNSFVFIIRGLVAKGRSCWLLGCSFERRVRSKWSVRSGPLSYFNGCFLKTCRFFFRLPWQRAMATCVSEQKFLESFENTCSIDVR